MRCIAAIVLGRPGAGYDTAVLLIGISNVRISIAIIGCGAPAEDVEDEAVEEALDDLDIEGLDEAMEELDEAMDELDEATDELEEVTEEIVEEEVAEEGGE